MLAIQRWIAQFCLQVGRKESVLGTYDYLVSDSDAASLLDSPVGRWMLGKLTAAREAVAQCRLGNLDPHAQTLYDLTQKAEPWHFEDGSKPQPFFRAEDLDTTDDEVLGWHRTYQVQRG